MADAGVLPKVPSKRARVVTAFIVTPLVAPLLYVLASPFFYGDQTLTPSFYLKTALEMTTVALLYGVTIATLVELLFGLPLWLLLKRYKLRSLLAYAAAGALASAIFFCLLLIFVLLPSFDMYSGQEISPFFLNTATFLLLVAGAISGIVFRQLMYRS
jgi:hypothetical protein